MFISVEGIDNIGKSATCSDIKKFLENQNQTVLLVNDPPRVEPWKSWKQTIQDSRAIQTPARAMLYFAARLDAVARIITPALNRKKTVIADRFLDSWFAYQVTAFEECMPREQSFQLLMGLHRSFLSAGLLVEPDKTFLIIGDPKALAQRRKNKKSSVYDTISTQTRVQENYIWLARRFGKDRIHMIDVSGKHRTEIVNEICREIQSGQSRSRRA
jgi:dTMP kinase